MFAFSVFPGNGIDAVHALIAERQKIGVAVGWQIFFQNVCGKDDCPVTAGFSGGSKIFGSMEQIGGNKYPFACMEKIILVFNTEVQYPMFEIKQLGFGMTMKV